MLMENRQNELLFTVIFQIISANLKTTSTTSTSHDLKSETWRPERFCLRSPNLPTAVTDDLTFDLLSANR